MRGGSVVRNVIVGVLTLAAIGTSVLFLWTLIRGWRSVACVCGNLLRCPLYPRRPPAPVDETPFAKTPFFDPLSGGFDKIGFVEPDQVEFRRRSCSFKYAMYRHARAPRTRGASSAIQSAHGEFGGRRCRFPATREQSLRRGVSSARGVNWYASTTSDFGEAAHIAVRRSFFCQIPGFAMRITLGRSTVSSATTSGRDGNR